MAAAGWTEQGMIETLSVCVRLELGPIFDEPSCLRPSAPPRVRPPGAPPGHTVLASPAPSTDCCPPRLPGAPMRPSLNWSDLRWGRSSPCPHAPPRVTLPLFLGPIFCPLAPPLDESGTGGGGDPVSFPAIGRPPFVYSRACFPPNRRTLRTVGSSNALWTILSPRPGSRLVGLRRPRRTAGISHSLGVRSVESGGGHFSGAAAPEEPFTSCFGTRCSPSGATTGTRFPAPT